MAKVSRWFRPALHIDPVRRPAPKCAKSLHTNTQNRISVTTVERDKIGRHDSITYRAARIAVSYANIKDDALKWYCWLKTTWLARPYYHHEVIITTHGNKSSSTIRFTAGAIRERRALPSVSSSEITISSSLLQYLLPRRLHDIMPVRGMADNNRVGKIATGCGWRYDIRNTPRRRLATIIAAHAT